MNPGPERIVLVGFMGAGKTSAGKELSRRLGWEFIDLDEEIERVAGRSVRELFRGEGEAAFRVRERDCAQWATLRKKVVIAAGGGAFAEGETRSLLQAGAVTIWLRCDLETLLERIGQDPSRPLASDRETMRQLLEQRRPAYEQAQVTVEDEGTPGQMADRILKALQGSVETR